MEKTPRLPSHPADATLSPYWTQLGTLPLLPAHTQIELAAQYRRTGDPALAQQLVCANLRLVAKIVREYRTSRENFADLLQEGNLGLMRAVERFDPARGVKLTTYAAWWIRAFILRFLMEQGQVVKSGTTRASRRAFIEGRRPPRDLSLNQPIGQDGDASTSDGLCRQDLLRDDEQRRPDVEVEAAEVYDKFADVLERFVAGQDQRGRYLIKKRWRQENPATLAQVGKRLCLSGERVRQLEVALFNTLRATAQEELVA